MHTSLTGGIGKSFRKGHLVGDYILLQTHQIINTALATTGWKNTGIRMKATTAMCDTKGTLMSRKSLMKMQTSVSRQTFSITALGYIVQVPISHKLWRKSSLAGSPSMKPRSQSISCLFTGNGHNRLASCNCLKDIPLRICCILVIQRRVLCCQGPYFGGKSPHHSCKR